jgi:hypothetical protein
LKEELYLFYQNELEIKDTTVTQIFASYLDLHNETDNGGRFKKSNSKKSLF